MAQYSDRNAQALKWGRLSRDLTLICTRLIPSDDFTYECGVSHRVSFLSHQHQGISWLLLHYKYPTNEQSQTNLHFAVLTSSPIQILVTTFARKELASSHIRPSKTTQSLRRQPIDQIAVVEDVVQEIGQKELSLVLSPESETLRWLGIVNSY